MIEAGALPRDPTEGGWTGRALAYGASKAARPAPPLTLWLVRSAFSSIHELRGDPSDSPRRGCAPTDSAGVCVQRVRGLDFVGASKAVRPAPFRSVGAAKGYASCGLSPLCAPPFFIEIWGDTPHAPRAWAAPLLTLPTCSEVRYDSGLRCGVGTSPSLPRVPLLARRGAGDGGAVGGLGWGVSGGRALELMDDGRRFSV